MQEATGSTTEEPSDQRKTDQRRYRLHSPPAVFVFRGREHEPVTDLGF